MDVLRAPFDAPVDAAAQPGSGMLTERPNTVEPKEQFGVYDDSGPFSVRVHRAYQHAKSIVEKQGMKMQDISDLSERFWAFHSNVDAAGDTAATTILTIHWNLCMGTIGKYLPSRPDLQPLLEKLERFDVCGDFMLTEVGHGLDARNIETTATLNPDGSFDLHTPTLSAAKIMPPTSPLIGMPRAAVVFARLVVDGTLGSIRPFIVDIHNSHTMASGVTSRLLPPKPGSKAVDHSVTSFNHVRLESTALLGQIEEPSNVRKEFLKQIERVTVGTLALSMTNIPSLRTSAYILARYSQRRLVAGRRPGERVPIIAFSTQHRPILLALTYASIMEQFAHHMIDIFKGLSAEDPTRGAIACVFKQTAIHWTQSTLSEMVDRCGWQGLYSHNQIIELLMAQRGNSIAEGDVMVLCLRLVAELMVGRYSLPPPLNPDCALARYETELWSEVSDAMVSLGSEGQSHEELFNKYMMPRCRALVQATGQRMAFEAAVASGKINPELLSMFETACMMEDPSFHASIAAVSRVEIFRRNAAAVQALLPQLEELLAASDGAHCAVAPILSQAKWMDFVEALPAFKPDDVPVDEAGVSSTMGVENLSTTLQEVRERFAAPERDSKTWSRL